MIALGITKDLIIRIANVRIVKEAVNQAGWGMAGHNRFTGLVVRKDGKQLVSTLIFLAVPVFLTGPKLIVAISWRTIRLDTGMNESNIIRLVV